MANLLSSYLNPRQKLQQAQALHQQGKLDQARIAYESIVAAQPKDAQCLYLLGTVNFQLKRFDKAEEILQRALQINPAHVPAMLNLAMAQSASKKYEPALSGLRKALAIESKSLVVKATLANVLVRAKFFDEALDLTQRWIDTGVNDAEIWTIRGLAFSELQRDNEFAECLDCAIAIDPTFYRAQSLKVVNLVGLDRAEEARTLADRLVAAAPDFADGHEARATVYFRINDYEEALRSYRRAFELSGNIACVTNGANCCNAQRREVDAIRIASDGLKHHPDHHPLFAVLGQAREQMGDFEGAIREFDSFLSIEPDNALILYKKAWALLSMKRYSEAKKCLEKCDMRKESFVLSDYMYATTMMGDWGQFDQRLSMLIEGIESDSVTCNTFPLVGLLNEDRLHRKAAKMYLKRHRWDVRHVAIEPHSRGEKIRLGYFSADFHDHATMHLMAEIFEAHDPEKFEIYGFSFGTIKSDQVTKRVAPKFKEFFYVKDWTVAATVAKARELRLDLAVDLKGFTSNSRFELFVQGCAPVQVSYLGYPGTLGSDFIDYIIADKSTIPEKNKIDFDEKVIYMPHSYQCNDGSKMISESIPSKVEFGLPENGFVFCCFNNVYKILPGVFESWMRVLQAIPKSVLWLYRGSADCVRNLREHAARLGVDPSRLVFADNLPLADHLARLRYADLFLDTVPCNAHTTASDALWAGVPLLTCRGGAFPGRVAASLLTALSLEELITDDLDAYESRALALARDPGQLQSIRTKLLGNLKTSPLYDSRRFTRNLESAYKTIVDRHYAGLPPESFEVVE